MAKPSSWSPMTRTPPPAPPAPSFSTKDASATSPSSKVMKYLHLIWSNLKRKKLRTLLTLLSVVVAFILFGLLSSIKQALTGGVSIAGQNRLVVRHKVSLIQLLPVSYKERMEIGRAS